MNTPTNDLHHAAPTWENQLWHARRLASDKGLDALYSPHAMTGRICGCGSCFCCAALYVYNELRNTTLGQQRDNCPACEGTGWQIDFAAIRAATAHPRP